MHPDNQGIHIPVIFAASTSSAGYFKSLDQFIRYSLGDEAAKYYDIIIDQPETVAQKIQAGIEKVHHHRRKHSESYAYNWQLVIPPAFQQPFDPTHANMKKLQLNRNQSSFALAAELRCAFSGIVAGNVKADGIEQIKQHGPYQLMGDKELMQALDSLLVSFVEQGRMKLKGEYKPCYELLS